MPHAFSLSMRPLTFGNDIRGHFISGFQKFLGLFSPFPFNPSRLPLAPAPSRLTTRLGRPGTAARGSLTRCSVSWSGRAAPVRSREARCRDRRSRRTQPAVLDRSFMDAFLRRLRRCRLSCLLLIEGSARGPTADPRPPDVPAGSAHASVATARGGCLQRWSWTNLSSCRIHSF